MPHAERTMPTPVTPLAILPSKHPREAGTLPILSGELIADRGASIVLPWGDLVMTPARVAVIAEGYLRHADIESLAGVLLDEDDRMLGVYRIATGGHNMVHVTIRDIFVVPFVARASAIVLLHNHPIGPLTPSADDLALTCQAMAEGRQRFDIAVRDHIIVGIQPGQYFAFSDYGLMPQGRQRGRLGRGRAASGRAARKMPG